MPKAPEVEAPPMALAMGAPAPNPIVEAGAKLETLPSNIQEILNILDFSGGGTVPDSEVQQTVSLLKNLRKQSGDSSPGFHDALKLVERQLESQAADSVEMEYMHLPENIQKVFRGWDADSSGKINAHELTMAADAWIQMQKGNTMMKRLLGVAVLVMILMFVGMFVMGMVTAEMAKEFIAGKGGSSKMETKTGNTVQTNNGEMNVDANGNLLPRTAPKPKNVTSPGNGTAGRRLKKAAEPAGLATRATNQAATISSTMPNTWWSEVKVLKIKMSAAADAEKVSLKVQGFSRIFRSGSKCGTIITATTDNGALTFDDTALYASDELVMNLMDMGFFFEAGAMTAFGHGRRLASKGAQIAGMFNYLQDYVWKCSTVKLPMQNLAPPFSFQTKRAVKCPTAAACKSKKFQNLAIPGTSGDLKTVSITESVVASKKVTLSMIEYANYPLMKWISMLNMTTSRKREGQLYNNKLYFCKEAEITTDEMGAIKFSGYEVAHLGTKKEGGAVFNRWWLVPPGTGDIVVDSSNGGPKTGTADSEPLSGASKEGGGGTLSSQRVNSASGGMKVELWTGEKTNMPYKFLVPGSSTGSADIFVYFQAKLEQTYAASQWAIVPPTCETGGGIPKMSDGGPFGEKDSAIKFFGGTILSSNVNNGKDNEYWAAAIKLNKTSGQASKGAKLGRRLAGAHDRRLSVTVTASISGDAWDVCAKWNSKKIKFLAFKYCDRPYAHTADGSVGWEIELSLGGSGGTKKQPMSWGDKELTINFGFYSLSAKAFFKARFTNRYIMLQGGASLTISAGLNFGVGSCTASLTGSLSVTSSTVYTGLNLVCSISVSAGCALFGLSFGPSVTGTLSYKEEGIGSAAVYSTLTGTVSICINLLIASYCFSWNAVIWPKTLIRSSTSKPGGGYQPCHDDWDSGGSFKGSWGCHGRRRYAGWTYCGASWTGGMWCWMTDQKPGNRRRRGDYVWCNGKGDIQGYLRNYFKTKCFENLECGACFWRRQLSNGPQTESVLSQDDLRLLETNNAEFQRRADEDSEEREDMPWRRLSDEPDATSEPDEPEKPKPLIPIPEKKTWDGWHGEWDGPQVE